MRNLKFSIIIIAVAIIIVLAAATIVESVNGTQFAHQNIYGSVWFLALWTVFTVVATAYILKRKLYRRINVFLIQSSSAPSSRGPLPRAAPYTSVSARQQT